MDINAQYKLWLEKAVADPDLIEELKQSRETRRKSLTDFTVTLNSELQDFEELSVQAPTE